MTLLKTLRINQPAAGDYKNRRFSHDTTQLDNRFVISAQTGIGRARNHVNNYNNSLKDAGLEFRIPEQMKGSELFICIDNPHVSRYHALVEAGPDVSLIFSDLGSTNGSFVLTQESPEKLYRIGKKKIIKPGDMIRIGKEGGVEFIYEIMEIDSFNSYLIASALMPKKNQGMGEGINKLVSALDDSDFNSDCSVVIEPEDLTTEGLKKMLAGQKYITSGENVFLFYLAANNKDKIFSLGTDGVVLKKKSLEEGINGERLYAEQILECAYSLAGLYVFDGCDIGKLEPSKMVPESIYLGIRSDAVEKSANPQLYRGVPILHSFVSDAVTVLAKENKPVSLDNLLVVLKKYEQESGIIQVKSSIGNSFPNIPTIF